ncbi:MAG: hypothetical protein RLO12_03580 [Fulvivirga sp.]
MEARDKLSDIIPVEAVQERDTDLLVLEELKCNRNFTDWVLTKTIGQPSSYDLIGAWHSLSQVGLGESDLAFKIKTDNQEIIFLIENKIGADFQPDQAGRYRKRGQTRVDNGECDRFYTILLAPGKYIVRDGSFDFYIEYEEIREWYLAQDDLRYRGQYKADILNIAIEKLRRGYSAIVDEGATEFWWYYYHYANDRYPHLKMIKPPAGIPKGSSFMMFKPTDIGLEKGDFIIHKGYGVVDLQLAGKAEHVDKLIAQFSETLTNEMEIVKAGKSASIRIVVDPIDVTKDINSQQKILQNAIQKADRLYQWAKEHLKK